MNLLVLKAAAIVAMIGTSTALKPAEHAAGLLAPTICLGSAGALADHHSIIGTARQLCLTTSGSTNSSQTVIGSSGPRIETVDCGRVKVGMILENSPNHFCAAVQGSCSVQSRPQAPTDPKATTVGFLQQGPSGTWELNGFDCNVLPGTGAPPPPQVTPFDGYAAVLRLVPSPAIGAAPGKGRTLVNMQTIFWVNAATDQSLGPVTLLGHQVGLQIHARATAWAFGDGITDTSAGLGRPYTPADGCADANCAGYFGHTYASTGAMTVSATVTWAGEFSVDGGPWRGIANPATGANTVDGPAATRPMRVIQARGVLVQDPGALHRVP